jgi:hypothetical protein
MRATKGIPRRRIVGTCADCGNEYARPTSGNVSPVCVSCRRERKRIYMAAHGRKWRAANPQRNAASSRAGYLRRKASGLCQNCGKIVVEQGRATCAPCRNKRKQYYPKAQETRFMNKYGLTPEQVRAQTERQDSLCGICRGAMPIPHIDHDHETGAFRGMLCGPCNQTLGLMKDDPQRFLNAARYLVNGGYAPEHTTEYDFDGHA